MDLIVCLIILLIICGAFLGVAKALLATPQAAWLAGWSGVVYALCVLLAVLVVIGTCIGIPAIHVPTFHR